MSQRGDATGESTIPSQPIGSWPENSRGYVVVALIAAGVMILHIATNGRYGFHRDELQVLDDARHLTWGFVAYPPLTPFRARIGMAPFDTSLTGLRLFSVFAQGAVIILTGLMARELVTVLEEKHPRRVLRSYFEYYKESRAHLSLGKDFSLHPRRATAGGWRRG
jgi:hypothetical protein